LAVSGGAEWEFRAVFKAPVLKPIGIEAACAREDRTQQQPFGGFKTPARQECLGTTRGREHNIVLFQARDRFVHHLEVLRVIGRTVCTIRPCVEVHINHGLRCVPRRYQSQQQPNQTGAKLN
jgi:hypothetical protein